MTFWTLTRLTAALDLHLEGARPTGNELLRGITTDTRAIAAGDVFVALRGERFDGHDFLDIAVNAGVAALVVEDPSRAATSGVPVFAVGDTRVALGALAKYRRRAWPGTVISVAGSNGKTTTKELIAAVLANLGVVHATRGNLNNTIGVPLTLLALPDHASVAVVEMGTDHPGEIDALRRIVAADIAVVTSIGEEHLEGLGDLEGVLQEESSALDEVSLGIVPSAVPALVAESRRRATRTLTAGRSDADLAPTAWGLAENGNGWFDIGATRFTVPLPGAHNVENALLAVAVSQALGVDLDAAAAGLLRATVPGMRSALETCGEHLLLNDAYNANPGSMRAALDTLTGIASDRPKVAVLGSMLELGDASDALHDEIALRALESPLILIGAVGDFAGAFTRVLGRGRGQDISRVVVAPDVEALWPLIEARLPRAALMLLKGSRGMRMERLISYLSPIAEASRQEPH